MQLLTVFIAGAALCGGYLVLLHRLLFGRHAAEMSLLLAITGFVEGTVVLLGIMYLLAQGSVERLLAALAGFVLARAVLTPRVLGKWEEAELPALSGEREGLGQQALDRFA